MTAPSRVLEIDDRKLLLNRLDDELWPEAGVTKADLIDYYVDVADRLLPFVAGRPVSLLRAPDPITGECAYQKTAPAGLPPWIPTRRIRSEHAALGYADYLLVPDRATLVYLVNLGFISLHPWACTVEALDRPDLMALDLDPTEIAFREVRNAALLVRDLLGSFRVRAWVKTSGGRGLHILVPLQPNHTFAQVRTAAETITRLARSREPSLFTLDMRRARRRGKILIDVHRNHRGATLVSPWAVREYPSATVSTPIEWPELERAMYPEDFTLATIRERLARTSDPFATFYQEPQSLASLLESGRSRRARPLA
ncbi:MAG TPA: non-homologous end-joining DNA ligase [Methylomirabilota bacterium]|jgi:bifunctional non-homologous end joining protein LigD|nr:non-homologous end-joining DNA ligase [Methylomirabilota bacterium]